MNLSCAILKREHLLARKHGWLTTKEAINKEVCILCLHLDQRCIGLTHRVSAHRDTLALTDPLQSREIILK